MIGDLRQAVGRGMPNLKEDVRLVQRMLDRWAVVTRNRIAFIETEFGRDTQRAIEIFQREVMGIKFPTGIVKPYDATARKLETPPHKRPEYKRLHLPPRTGFRPLSEEDYEAAAKKLECEVRVIKAVALQESKGKAFDERGRPRMLFERKHFDKLTNHRFEKSHPSVTLAIPKRYGSFDMQWTRLEEAYSLNSGAALQAASWGKFQILGSNYMEAGFGSVELLVAAMCWSEQEQLLAFIAFVSLSPIRRQALQSKDWSAFAASYNGKYYKDQHYDTGLEECYDKTKP